ncbi:RNA-directed DNA polymerase, eukaryota, reverse transcriptase zinc-binding domain protein [Tanacetum coccineum]
MGDTRSKEDDEACMQYGRVVDSYIPNRRTKSGKRFGFVRFVKAFDVDRLINNLCTIWIGSFKIHANIAKFQRLPLTKNYSQSTKQTQFNSGEIKKDSCVNRNSYSYSKVVQAGSDRQHVKDDKPAIVLDDSCLNYSDYSLAVMGKVKEFGLMSNLKLVLANEGFVNIQLKYLGGYWVMIEFFSKDSKEKFMANVGVSSWFSTIQQASNAFYVDERVTWVDIEGIPLKVWICIKTKSAENISESFKIIVHGKVLWVRAKEVDGWVPDIVEEEESDIDTDEETMDGGIQEKKQRIINMLLWKAIGDNPKYPPGFTPLGSTDVLSNGGAKLNGDGKNINRTISNLKEDMEESVCSGHIKQNEIPRSRGSILQVMDDLVKVGQTMGYKMEGCLAQKAKKNWVKELCTKNKVNFVSLQETKMEMIDLFIIKTCWGNLNFDYAYSPSVELSEKMMLWDYLLLMINNWKGDVIIMGDFNEVRRNEERFGSVFNARGANIFNRFISNAGLEEVPLGGSYFTWCHKSATKMSKLDRFLISEGLMMACPGISAITLDRYLSDHRPILLRESHANYGPVPFRFFHSWFELEGFDSFVETTWNDIQIHEPNAMRKLLKKMKYLKEQIRIWIQVKKEYARNHKKNLKEELATIDVLLDKGEGITEILDKRSLVLNSIHDVDKLEEIEAGLETNVTRDEIKRAVWYCGVDKSPGPDGFTFGFYRRYWNSIENDVSHDANMVKDFRPITLIGSLYKIITKILANRLLVVLGDLVNDVQSAFIANRQILNGPFILNEVVQWCKRKKKQSMIFKVDFEKAYDSVRWDYLDDVLNKFGFDEKWRGWIQSCLISSRGSIMVNGSPTREFQLHKGLKQGDPLSPFLFILIMESLHISVQRVVDTGMLRGITLGPSLQISHLFYVDDAVFMGQWSELNIDTITQMLACFYRALGLRINMNKSKLMGIYVDSYKVDQAATKIGCATLTAPFSYLGSTVGGNMSQIKSWDEIIMKVEARLSKWKMKTLSIGGRLTLLKSVLGLIPIYHMSIFKVPKMVLRKLESIRCRFFHGIENNERKPIWVKWNKVLASKERGGLGVSSLFALNRALLFKWVWRFRSQNDSLWARVIRGIHGDDGKLGATVTHHHSSIWLDIIQEVDSLKRQGMDLVGFIRKKVGDGNGTLFWEDTWKGDVAFKVLYPRIYALDSAKSVSVASKLSQNSITRSFRRDPRGGTEQSQFNALMQIIDGITLADMSDRWVWVMEGSGEFSVASTRRLIDKYFLPDVTTKTRWITGVPIKVNIHAWRVKLDCLPTRLNISKRGMLIDSILCPSCNIAIESSNHAFFECNIAKEVFRKITRWWDISCMEVSCYEDWLTWLLNLPLHSKHKHLLEGVCYISWWLIWIFRNKSIFGSDPPLKSSLFDDVVARSFIWMKASSSKIILTMDVHYNGHFTRNPVTYAKGTKLTLHNIEVSRFKFEDLFEYVRSTIDSIVTEIYYNQPNQSLEKGLTILRCDDDLKEFVKLGSKHDGRISLYVVHSLEGGIDNEEEDNCWIENDRDKELADSDADSDANSDADSDVNSDADSVASVDHLSEGEEELRQVILKKAKSKISKESLDDFDFNVPLENDHEEEAGKEFNPMFSNVESQEGGNYVEPDVENDEMNDTYKWIIHDPNTHWKLQKPILGERYDNFDQLKDCLIFYSVANGYQLWYEKSDSKKLLVKCGLDQKKKKGETVDPSKPKCPFNMRAVKMRDENTVHIRSLKDKHTCTRQYYLGSLITSKWIAQRFEDKLRMNPDMKVVDLQEYVMKKYRVKVSHHQCNRAKRMALYQLKQNVSTQYDRLVDYCYELKRSNPGTTVGMQVDPLADGKHMFNSYYVCIQQLKEGWKVGCRKIIGIDGCFLKGICQGELLAAVGRDANNQIYPIAWAVVQVENTENWEWFLQHLRQDLDLKDGTGVALISDGHKGIIQAVKRVVPNVEHRSFFKVGVDCDAVENGLSESFNSHIRIARRKPILGLFEDIKCYVMQRNATLRKECEKWEDDICPNIRKVLELHKRIQRKWTLIPSGWMQFEVRQGNGLEAFNVQLDNKTCSCGQWQLTCIPCPHSITAMCNVNMNPEDFVTDSFRLATYKKLYEFNIKHVKGIDQWRKIKHIPCLPPKEKRMPRRPSIARKKDKSKLRKHAPPVEKIPMKKGRPLVEDPINARVPAKRKRKASPTNKPGPSKKGGACPINQDGAADGVDEMANGEEVQVDGVEDRADKDLVDIDVEFENVEVGRKFENIEVEFELIGVEVINEEQEDEVDLQDDGVDLQEDRVDLQADGVDLLKDGVDLQDDGVDLQEDEVDLQHDGAELQDDGHNIQPAVAPARVRTRRQSQRLVMRNWNRRPMPTVNGEGTTPEKAFLIL